MPAGAERLFIGGHPMIGAVMRHFRHHHNLIALTGVVGVTLIGAFSTLTHEAKSPEVSFAGGRGNSLKAPTLSH